MLRSTKKYAAALVLSSAAAVGLGAGVPACIASGPPIDPITDDDDGGFGAEDAGPPDAPPLDAPVTEPHTIVGATPSHGPFSGGQRVVITGNGFDADVRVWFGDEEVSDVVAIDATRLQVVAPPGDAGAVELSTQNGDDASTNRSLPGGYTYDTLYADPPTGPVAGGTETRILGQGTSWDEDTTAFIGDKPCTETEIVSETEIACLVPKGTPGAKPVRVVSGEDTIVVLDGYTYEDSSDGFKGGLSGDPLAGSMRVLVYNNFTGEAIPGAFVVLGDDVETGIVRQVEDASGVVVIEDPSLDSPVTVTVGALCHSPITFVDVPVDTVTMYLDPILTPACASGGDPPGVGGSAADVGIVSGEIVFPTTQEFQRGPFLVPEPIGDERVVAYLFVSSPSPLTKFLLPPAQNAITPTADGGQGYAFAASTAPGNRAYYVLAGLEDRTKNPARFIAYSMGVVRGVPVVGGETTSEVYIHMEPLDLAMTIEANPPDPGPSGPDRFAANVAIRLGADGFAILPTSEQTPLLPLSDDVHIVGLPLLANTLEGATYFVSSRAVTGDLLGAPLSVVSSQQTTTTAFPLVVDGFVGLPQLSEPSLNSSWDGRHLETSFGSGSPIDLTVYDIISESGLVHWLVAAPDGGGPVTLPDMRQLQVGLPSGGITVGVYGARIDAFEYGKLRYRHLRPVGMTAYSLDFVEAHLP